MRFGNASSVSAFAALGLTAAAAIVAMGFAAPEPTPPVAHADSTVLLRVVDGSVVISSQDRSLARTVIARDDALDPGHDELELSGLSAMAAERDLAEDQAGEASALLETMKSARAGAVEQSTRAAERARLATASPRELGQILAAERGFTGEPVVLP